MKVNNHNNIRITPVKKGGGFISVPIMADEYRAGDEFGRTLGARAVVNPRGDWRELVGVVAEHQSPHGFESMSCVTFGTLNAIEMLLHHKKLECKPNYSDRFTSYLSGTTRNGNLPQKVCENVRHKGLLPERLLPFSDEITTWEQFYSGVTEDMKAIAQTFVAKYQFGHEWLITDGERMPIEEIQMSVREALRYSPVGVSVYGWATDSEGLYVKPRGLRDNHWCIVVAIEDGNYVVLDQYPDESGSFLKVLRGDYRFGVAKSFSIEKRVKVSFWARLLQLLQEVLRA